MKLLNKIMITCQKATLLTAKESIDDAGFYESVKLKLHLSMCSGCRTFQNQINAITSKLNNNSDELKLSESDKRKIIEHLQE